MNQLMTVGEANTLIDQGRRLHVAGEETLLAQLHHGSWIGGTIPYFLTGEGGVVERERLFVTELPEAVTEMTTRFIDMGHIPAMVTEAPQNGFSIVIAPGLSDIHTTLGLTANSIPGIYDTPIIGWVAGVHLEEIGSRTPKVFDGATGNTAENSLVVLHASLPLSKVAHVGMINLFVPGNGDIIVFREPSFTAGICTVNGEQTDFYDYVVDKGLDLTLPLITERAGHNINVSFQRLDHARRKVRFYAPVMHGRSYVQAQPLPDYREALMAATKRLDCTPAFSCNCILNYVYGRLEGAQFITVPGPATFGEFAHILVNQTLVYLTIGEK